jgi:hypothetical protein
MPPSPQEPVTAARLAEARRIARETLEADRLAVEKSQRGTAPAGDSSEEE